MSLTLLTPTGLAPCAKIVCHRASSKMLSVSVISSFYQRQGRLMPQDLGENPGRQYQIAVIFDYRATTDSPASCSGSEFCSCVLSTALKGLLYAGTSCFYLHFSSVFQPCLEHLRCR